VSLFLPVFLLVYQTREICQITASEKLPKNWSHIFLSYHDASSHVRLAL